MIGYVSKMKGGNKVMNSVTITVIVCLTVVVIAALIAITNLMKKK
jgi:hypothetical protein